MVASDGRDIGRKMRNRICGWLAPSMTAASSISTGIPRKKFIIRIMYDTFIAPGSVSAQMVFISPSLLITMYAGIMPPLKSMVNTKYHENTVRPWKRLFALDSGYAVRITSRILMGTPMTTRSSVMLSDFQNWMSSIT